MGGVAEFVPAAHAEGCESGGVEGHGFLFSRKEEGGKRKEITIGGAGTVCCLQFTVYSLQMITVQAIRFVYSLKFIVYR